ncbi:MAG TPA: tetratricopeptide repeat protein [Rugosibacter sp.]|nr:tetratricopeptide repeat protein [Rugosibacter sp.]
MNNNMPAFRLFLAILAASANYAQALPTDSRTGGIVMPATPSAMVTDEKPANAEFRKGIAAQLKGEMAAAKKHFLTAVKLDEKFTPPLIGLADITLKEGNRIQAENYLRQAERTAPQAAEVHLGWGRFHLGASQFSQAETSFKKARDINPASITPLLELGDLYLKNTSRLDDAVQAFTTAVALAPDNKFAVYSLGVASAMAGRRDDALKAFDRAAALAPQDPAPLRAAGRLHLEAGKADKALAAFNQGLQRQPGFIPLMLDRSDALAMKGQWPETIRQLETAARAAPKSADVQIKLGDAHQGARHWKDAQSAYAKAISLDSKNPLAYNNLAWMLVTQGGSPKKAVESAKKAVSLSPDSAPFYDTLGWAQRAAGDLNAASESLKRATMIEPKSAEFQFHYGTVLAELKQNRAARSALKRALLDPDFSQIEEARKLLNSLPTGD